MSSAYQELRAAIDEKMRTNPRLTRGAAAVAVYRQRPELRQAAVDEANAKPNRS